MLKPIPQDFDPAKEAGLEEEEATPERRPRPVNGPAVVELAGGEAMIAFRGDPWIASRLSYPDGVELEDIRLEVAEFETMKREDLEGYRAALDRAAEILGDLVRPSAPPASAWLAFRPRALWRHLRARLGLYRNPFRDATEAELWAMLDFFSRRRTDTNGRRQ